MDPILPISRLAFEDEAQAVAKLLALLPHISKLEPAIFQEASQMVHVIRNAKSNMGIEAFLQDYGLDTAEGIALMCLAEALLRIPDAATADALIHDKFTSANWQTQLGQSDSWFINASSWGLLLTGKVINLADKPSILGKLTARLGEPVAREALKAAVRFIGRQFVLGETIEEAISHSKPFREKGYRFSYDILGEGARSEAQAQHFLAGYQHAIGLLSHHTAYASMSVKLSALHPRYSLAQRERVIGELLPRLKILLLQARQAGVAISIDAEEASRLDIELELFSALFADQAFAGWEGIGFVVQAYQKRALPVIEFLSRLSRQHKRRIPLRLVKGAYWDSEIKAAQLAGLPGYPVYTQKAFTDTSYLACADAMLQASECFHLQFATHNARTAASIQALATHHGIAANEYEFQRLHGMGESLHGQLLQKTPSRIYAPVGEHKDLLAYLIRRLLENGANSSFVHLLMDEAVGAEELLRDPIEESRQLLTQPHSIPLPLQLYPNRRNSMGIDFGNLAQTSELQAALNKQAPIPNIAPTNVESLQTACEQAKYAFADWSKTPIEQRATILERAADLLEEQRNEFLSLLIYEAGKTIPDALAEVREAADFCRYYAEQARISFSETTLPGPTGERNSLSLHPRGTFACISPWNFPLAIFTGQIAAALVTGNTVLAKSAEQTPAIAARAVALLHQAGIPPAALQLITGPGETIGAALVAHPAVAGVVFTGSVDTARHINRALANRPGPILPFIAETGGQNCLVVDSSALLEQAVDDIIASAFGSAGQRCSAARILLMQEDVADSLLALLAGAMQELKLGNPAELDTDIGPVIDADAHAMLETHIAQMKKEAKLVAAAPLPQGLSGHFVAPHCFEIDRLDQLEREIFGPVLHVLRFKQSEMKDLSARINALGYGLTFGIHSRIDEHIAHFTNHVRAGNIYINRSMIGATVGVQPFGGEGLSGTGPKAGGPHYLLRFVTERAVSVNTAAVGGNINLLAGS